MHSRLYCDERATSRRRGGRRDWGCAYVERAADLYADLVDHSTRKTADSEQTEGAPR